MSVPAVEEFRRSIEELREASEREGIDRHGMLGTWLAALEKVLERMAGLVEAQEEGLTKTVSEAKALCDGELAKVRELTRAANAALHQARTALIQEEVIRENLVVRMIDQTFPMFAERLQKCLFIKEWVVNSGIRQRRFYLHGAIALTVVLASYVAGRLDQAGPSQDELIGSYCRTKVFQYGGHSYCLMDGLATQSQ